MNSSLSPTPALMQSLSLPGRLSLPLAAELLRETAAEAAREASRARAARMMRATMASATVRLLFSHSSSPGRIRLSIWP